MRHKLEALQMMGDKSVKRFLESKNHTFLCHKVQKYGYNILPLELGVTGVNTSEYGVLCAKGIS